MWELKSKKTGKISILTDKELEDVKKAGIVKRFTLTEIKPMRQVVSPLREVKKEVTKAKAKDE